MDKILTKICLTEKPLRAKAMNDCIHCVMQIIVRKLFIHLNGSVGLVSSQLSKTHWRRNCSLWELSSLFMFCLDSMVPPWSWCTVSLAQQMGSWWFLGGVTNPHYLVSITLHVLYQFSVYQQYSHWCYIHFDYWRLSGISHWTLYMKLDGLLQHKSLVKYGRYKPFWRHFQSPYDKTNSYFYPNPNPAFRHVWLHFCDCVIDCSQPFMYKQLIRVINFNDRSFKVFVSGCLFCRIECLFGWLVF